VNSVFYMVAIWPFMKWSARNKMIRPFGHFVAAYFGEIWAKLAIFYEILTLKLYILTNFLQKFGLFSFLRVWPYLKLLMANFGLFIFFSLATLFFMAKDWIVIIKLLKTSFTDIQFFAFKLGHFTINNFCICSKHVSLPAEKLFVNKELKFYRIGYWTQSYIFFYLNIGTVYFY
jgi:hypothetical protein